MIRPIRVDHTKFLQVAIKTHSFKQLLERDEPWTAGMPTSGHGQCEAGKPAGNMGKGRCIPATAPMPLERWYLRSPDPLLKLFPASFLVATIRERFLGLGDEGMVEEEELLAGPCPAPSSSGVIAFESDCVEL
jgi:hypothetical protein